MGLKHIAIGTALVAALGVGAYFSFLNNPEPSPATQPAGLEQLVTAPGQPIQPPQTENYTSISCDNIPCSLPEAYGTDVYKPACDNYNHCANNDSDSYNELLISRSALDSGVLGLEEGNLSYIDGNTVIIKYKDGTGPGHGVRVKDLFWIIQDADNCNDFKIQKTGDAYNKNYEIVALFGKGEDGNLYRIAMTYTGKKCNGRVNGIDGNGIDGNTGNCNLDVNINVDIDNNITINQSGQTPPPVPPPIEYIAPRLTDNAWNEVAFRTSIKYEEIYLTFCEGGTDGNGKVITPCTPDRRINKEIFPEAIIFKYIKTDEKDPKTHIYGAPIPNIPGTEEATYRMIGYKLNNKQYWENANNDSDSYNEFIPQIGVAQNIQQSPQQQETRKKKGNFLTRIFGKKD